MRIGLLYARIRVEEKMIIEELEKRMYKHAENLEFEEAARLRDEAQRLRDLGLRALPGVASA